MIQMPIRLGLQIIRQAQEGYSLLTVPAMCTTGIGCCKQLLLLCSQVEMRRVCADLDM